MNGNEWVRKPFNKNNVTGTGLTLIQEDKLLKLSCDRGLEASFKNERSLSTFWIKIRAEYVEVSGIANKVMLLSPSTYLCETGFSALTSLKTKRRNRLDVRASLLAALSNIEPRLDKLCSRKQAHYVSKLRLLLFPLHTGGLTVREGSDNLNHL
jgi:hypothetical protein